MTNVKMLLGQFTTSWHQDEIDMQKRLALEQAFNQLREKAMDLLWSKVSIPLPLHMQLMFNLSLFLITKMDSVHS